jgi:hypothetical protein
VVCPSTKPIGCLICAMSSGSLPVNQDLRMSVLPWSRCLTHCSA